MPEYRWIEALEPRHVDTIPAFDPYVETFWLPTVGPSCVFLYRRLVLWLEGEPGGLTIDVEQTGKMLGLHGGVGKNAVIMRTFSRLAEFHLVEEDGWLVRVHTMLPHLTTRQIERLPERLRALHPAPTNNHTTTTH
jgi:hypothetical protein